MAEATETMGESNGQAGGLARYLIPLALLVIAGGLVVLVAMLPENKETPPDNGVPPVNVRVETVQAIPELTDAFTLSAVVEPYCVVRVAAEVSGRIERYGRRTATASWRGQTFTAGIELKEGEPVAAGQPIVHLNTELLAARYEQARAQAEYDQLDFDRIADLYERGVTSKTEFDNARTRRSVSQALCDEAKRSLDRATIVAPSDGVLNQLPMEIGEYATPGDVVAEIVDIERVKITIDVPERDIHYLKMRDRAELIAYTPQKTTLSGAITYISEVADNASRTTRIEITVDNRAHTLRSGQIVEARLVRRVIPDAITIPLACVIPLENGRVVYVVNDGHALRREVELGFITGRDVRVLSGLEAEDTLIVVGQRYVGPGQPVTVISDDEPEATAATAPKVDDPKAVIQP